MNTASLRNRFIVATGLSALVVIAGCRKGPDDNRPFSERAGAKTAEVAIHFGQGALNATETAITNVDWHAGGERIAKVAGKVADAGAGFLKGLLEKKSEPPAPNP